MLHCKIDKITTTTKRDQMRKTDRCGGTHFALNLRYDELEIVKIVLSCSSDCTRHSKQVLHAHNLGHNGHYDQRHHSTKTRHI